MSLYETLGVREDASASEIKKAYRRLAIEHHPDNGGDKAKFQKVQDAGETLCDADLRARYDETGEADPVLDEHEKIALQTLAKHFMASELFVRDAIAELSQQIQQMRAELSREEVMEKKLRARIKRYMKSAKEKEVEVTKVMPILEGTASQLSQRVKMIEAKVAVAVEAKEFLTAFEVGGDEGDAAFAEYLYGSQKQMYRRASWVD